MAALRMTRDAKLQKVVIVEGVLKDGIPLPQPSSTAYVDVDIAS